MYAVIDCRTQSILETGTDYELLASKSYEKGLEHYIDFYIAEMYVIIDRNTQQMLAYGLTIDEVLKQIDYDFKDLDYFLGKASNFNRFTIIFLNEQTNEYIAIRDGELTMDKFINLEDRGFIVYSDIVTIEPSEYLKMHEIEAKVAKYKIAQITLKEAQVFVNQFHRHHKQPQGHRFSLGLFVASQLVGVIIAGRPVARMNDDKRTLEVTRCCVLPGFKNAITMLYGRVYQTAKIWGYERVITYTLETENGSSMKAAGFRCLGKSAGGSWSSKSRNRIDKHPLIPKYKWVKVVM